MSSTGIRPVLAENRVALASLTANGGKRSCIALSVRAGGWISGFVAATRAIVRGFYLACWSISIGCQTGIRQL